MCEAIENVYLTFAFLKHQAKNNRVRQFIDSINSEKFDTHRRKVAHKSLFEFCLMIKLRMNEMFKKSLPL